MKRFLLLFSILMIGCGTQTIRRSLPATSPASTSDPKVTLHENINQVLGTNDRNLLRLTKISYSDPEAGDITITWALNDNALQSSKKVTAQIDATNILKALENNKTRFIYVILIGRVTVQDKYGNFAEIQALSLGFNKSKLDMINWEGFQPLDVYNIAAVADIADEWK